VSAKVAAWLALEAWPVMRVLRLDEEAIATLQNIRSSWILERAFATAYYRERMHSAGFAAADLAAAPAAALRALAPVTKAELREAGATVLDGGVISETWYSSRSSGSTGEPFRMYYDPRAWAILKYLVKWRGRVACGARTGDRLALLDAIPADVRSRAMLERTGRIRRFSVLQERMLLAAQLLEFRPDILYGLPSALCEIADGLDRLQGDLRPRRVFTSGEILVRSRRERLAEAFECPVLDVYGTSETKEIAFECTEGSFHVNADVALVEILDEQGGRCEAGEEGEIVLTSLVNCAMPLIRFRTGDRGRLLSGLCSCGLHLGRLGVVTGRDVDMLQLPGGARLSPYALTTVIENVPGVKRYQVVQTEETGLLVKVIVEDEVRAREVEAGIRTAVNAATGGQALASVRFVDDLPKGPGGKVRVVHGMRAGGGGSG
jgi:phenylacetate-CoA ligase